MTPEEKSKELIAKFKPHSSTLDPVDLPNNRAHKKHAIENAIICVNELISEASDKNCHTGRNGLTDLEFWKQTLNYLNNMK